MKRSYGRPVIKLILIALVGIFLFPSCAPKALRQPTGSMDTPQHHVFSGMKMLDKTDLEGAIREFNLAIELDPKYSPAYQGLGVALGYEKRFDAAYEAMSNASKYSRTKEEEAMAYVGFMRLHTLEKKKGWLEDVEAYFPKAVARIEGLPEAYYHLGVAYKEAYRFNESEKAFKQVLAINKSLVGEADEQLKLVQKIQRAMPGTEVGKKIALQEIITRADCAALFIQELLLEKVYEKNKKLSPTAVNLPGDVKDHPLKVDVEAILRIGMRGLEVYPDGRFRPDDYVTRAVYAMMIEDVFVTVNHDQALSVKHVGSPSPFPDVRNDAPYFNAIMVCTTRGILEGSNVMTGHFNPEGRISGAEALLVIRKLKESLRIF
jgi:tetratricopeptide (TPR) repeat protein